MVALVVLLAAAGCRAGSSGPAHREHDPGRDALCKQSAKPKAYFYPAENRTDYKPDDPHRDGCELLVADHLFCCPDASRPTDR